MMPISQRIKQDLVDRLNEPHAFDLMNMFKGIPLVYKATLLHVNNEFVKFEVEPPSSVCLNWESHTIILDDRNTNAIRARVGEFDVIKGIVQLDDLGYFDRDMSHRTSVRVEPEEAIPATVTRGEECVAGEVIDVSLTGFGIRVPAQDRVQLQLNDNVRVSLKMMDLLVGPRGMIINIRKENGFNRLAFRFSEDVTIPVAIARYVIHRRAEIHREIRNAYYTAYTKNNPDRGQ